MAPDPAALNGTEDGVGLNELLGLTSIRLEPAAGAIAHSDQVS